MTSSSSRPQRKRNPPQDIYLNAAQPILQQMTRRSEKRRKRRQEVPLEQTIVENVFDVEKLSGVTVRMQKTWILLYSPMVVCTSEKWMFYALIVVRSTGWPSGPSVPLNRILNSGIAVIMVRPQRYPGLEPSHIFFTTY